MKKVLLTLTIVLAGVFAATAQTGNNQPVDTPVIRFNENLHDFGNIPQNVPATYEFVFTNTGNAPLIITNASASCGCTKPIYPNAPIMPGKTGVIKVTFNAAVASTFSKSVTVESNAGKVFLTIKGNVVAAPPQSPMVNPGK